MAFNDSINKRYNDSIQIVNEKLNRYNDSVSLLQEKIKDSIKLSNKRIADSLKILLFDKETKDLIVGSLYQGGIVFFISEQRDSLKILSSAEHIISFKEIQKFMSTQPAWTIPGYEDLNYIFKLKKTNKSITNFIESTSNKTDRVGLSMSPSLIKPWESENNHWWAFKSQNISLNDAFLIINEKKKVSLFGSTEAYNDMMSNLMGRLRLVKIISK
jgi:hypothetical protein